jgi:hypothetical protein
MATIMTQGNRRCDATCHTATKDKCGCICGGKYHGAKGAALYASDGPLAAEPSVNQLRFEDMNATEQEIYLATVNPRGV